LTETTTIARVKAEIESEEGIPVESQRLTYGNIFPRIMAVGAPTLVPERKLIHMPHSITDKTISVFVLMSPDGTTNIYEFGPPFTVDSLMGMIRSRQHISMHRQEFMFKGTKLSEFYTLSNYGIVNGDTIRLRVRDNDCIIM
jgi:hypothetical protein